MMNSTDLLQLVDNLQQAGKIYNLQQVCDVSDRVFQDRSKLDNWGVIFKYSCSAQLISFEIDCFYGMGTRIYEYQPPPPQISSLLRHWIMCCVVTLMRFPTIYFINRMFDSDREKQVSPPCRRPSRCTDWDGWNPFFGCDPAHFREQLYVRYSKGKRTVDNPRKSDARCL